MRQTVTCQLIWNGEASESINTYLELNCLLSLKVNPPKQVSFGFQVYDFDNIECVSIWAGVPLEYC